MGKVELFHLQKWSGDWNRIYCVVTSVCVFRFVESNSSANFWSSSDEDIMEDDENDVEESSNTQTDVTCCVM